MGDIILSSSDYSIEFNNIDHKIINIFPSYKDKEIDRFIFKLNNFKGIIAINTKVKNIIIKKQGECEGIIVNDFNESINIANLKKAKIGSPILGKNNWKYKALNINTRYIIRDDIEKTLIVSDSYIDIYSNSITDCVIRCDSIGMHSKYSINSTFYCDIIQCTYTTYENCTIHGTINNYGDGSYVLRNSDKYDQTYIKEYEIDLDDLVDNGQTQNYTLSESNQ